MADRTLRFAIRDLPVETVVSAVIAKELRRELFHSAIMWLSVVFILGAHQLTTNLNSLKFVPSDAPEQDLGLAGHRVEVPSVRFVPQENRQGPIFGADVQSCGSI